MGSVATEMLRRKVGLIHVPALDDPAVASVPMDGCIVAHPYGGDSVVSELLRRNVPLVTIEEDPERPDLPWAVRLDYTTAVTGLLDHLHHQGAGRIVLLTGSEDNAWNRRTRETHRDWCERNGQRARTELLSESLSAGSAATRVRRLLTAARRPDAVVVATSDQRLRRRRGRGRRGPGPPRPRGPDDRRPHGLRTLPAGHPADHRHGPQPRTARRGRCGTDARPARRGRDTTRARSRRPRAAVPGIDPADRRLPVTLPEPRAGFPGAVHGRLPRTRGHLRQDNSSPRGVPLPGVPRQPVTNGMSKKPSARAAE
ncbi:substrate-binding domain-containing protein [Streptomyces albus]